ncbi:MAG: FAD-dependent oxidoreductase [Oscillospiraceae bacterium]|nr:FAD-dependent oxidoreductase [Oscillospiraceae bacterium]
MEKTVDLVVVGSAASGLSCAVKARQLGVEKVLVLEKMADTGGCSKFAGQINGFDTPVQKRQGLYYSADDAFRDLIHVLNWNVDAKLVRKWLSGTGENIRWLEELGVVFSGVSAMNDRPDKHRLLMHSVPREHGKHTGYRIVEALLKNCEKLGIEILTNTPAKHLIKDEKTGAITGVIAETPDGSLTIRAKAVMLGTGSICANQELIKRFYNSDEYKDVKIQMNFPHNTGDGIIMAEEVGGAAGRISTVFIGPHNHFKGASEIVGAVTRRSHGIKINKLGERFQDESLPSEAEFNWMGCVSVDRQPGKICYNIIDRSILDWMIERRKDKVYMVDFGAISGNEIVTFGDSDAPPDLSDPTSWLLHFGEAVKREEAAGRAKICNSLEEVAEYVGCDPKTLKETFANYNDSCEKKYDYEFLKAPEYLFPLTQPPYYVTDGPSGIDCCIGGLSVNNHQSVIDKDGMPLPGLYAGGVLTSGWLAGLYGYWGSEMSYSVYSGRSAAQEVKEYIKGR